MEGGGWYVVIAVQRVRLKKPEKRHSLHGTDGIQKEKISEATTQSDRVRHRFGMRLVIFQCHHHHKKPKPFLVCDDDNNCMGLGAWIGHRIVDLEGGIMTHSDNLPEEQKVFTCGFCGKTDKQVSVIIAGPSVAICNECVRLCVGVLFDKAEGKTIRGEEPK